MFLYLSLIMPLIVSFDIGIKNLAYCVFHTGDNQSLSVKDWGVINLSDSAQQPTGHLCNCSMVKTNQPCNKKAVFCLDSNYYCKVHSKKSGKLLPNKETSMPTIRKLKLDELIQFCATHNITNIEPKDKKPDILQKVQTHFEKCTLQEIKPPKKSNANHIHLVEIGKRIKTNFDTRFQPFMQDITHVILENQISPIAGRMNTIQGMVAQYFIMRTESIHLDFVSSGGKLKGLSSTTNYSEHKKDGIRFCTMFLEANPAMASSKAVFEESTKKDDLADCLLQGIYYLKKQNIITYSDDLKIKFV